MIVAIAIILLVKITFKITKRSAEAKNKIIHAYTLDSTRITLPLAQPDTTLVLIFNSECEFCNFEINKLLSEIPTFDQYRILMLSRQNVNTLKQVFLHLKLNKYSNIELFKIDQHISEEPFISASTPSVFIYDTSGNLIINRKGYSDPRELINTILNEQKN